jgi:hypothetical protein
VRFSTALHRALTRADQGNWRRRLDDLHAEQGTWPGVAAELGVSAATLRRYRAGGYRSRGRWHPLKPDALYPRITRALRRRRNRAAAIGRADFKRLRLKGTWRVYEGKTRNQRMDAGRYMSPASIEGLTTAYLSGDNERVDRAFDFFLQEDYVPELNDPHMIDVEWLEI